MRRVEILYRSNNTIIFNFDGKSWRSTANLLSGPVFEDDIQMLLDFRVLPERANSLGVKFRDAQLMVYRDVDNNIDYLTYQNKIIETRMVNPIASIDHIYLIAESDIVYKYNTITGRFSINCSLDELRSFDHHKTFLEFAASEYKLTAPLQTPKKSGPSQDETQDIFVDGFINGTAIIPTMTMIEMENTHGAILFLPAFITIMRENDKLIKVMPQFLEYLIVRESLPQVKFSGDDRLELWAIHDRLREIGQIGLLKQFVGILLRLKSLYDYSK